jgi:hypothetical protein
MHRLEISKNKEYIWDPSTDRFLYVVQNKDQDAYYFNDTQRLQHILDLFQFRKTVEGKSRILSTAFITKLAKDFEGLRSATKAFSDLKGASKEDKNAITSFLSDVLYKKLEVKKLYLPFTFGIDCL